MIVDPQQYPSASTPDLLHAVAFGHVGADHGLIRALLDRGEAIIPDFLAFIKGEPPDERFDISEILLDVARALGTPGVLPFYEENARQSGFEFSDALLVAYTELGAAALDSLLALEKESEGASDVMFALAALRVRDDRILNVLTEYLHTDPTDASIALGLYGDPAAISALERAIEDAELDENVRDEIEGAIEEIKNADHREEAPFDIWKTYPEQDEPEFAALDNTELLEFLKSPVPQYRKSAIRMLAFDELSPDLAQTIFEAAKSDPDVPVRAAAWEALEGVEEPEAIPRELRAKLRDGDAPLEERAGALIAVAGDAREDETIRQFILDLFANPEMRVQAVKAMWHSGDRRFDRQITQALRDSDKEVVRQGMMGAGVFGLVSQLGRIEANFDDVELRKSALYSYALAAPGTATPGRMRQLFRRIEDLAGGLLENDAAIVGRALDERLEAAGFEPVFLRADTDDDGEDPDDVPEVGSHSHEHNHDHRTAAIVSQPKVGRNDPCPCGSGKKYKKCCGG